MSNRVIVTMTTIPPRLNDPREDSGIRPGLTTILNQTNIDYEVHLNIPHQYNQSEVFLPEWLYEWQNTYSNLKIFRCDDYGPITKIYPTIQRIENPDVILITVDDDLIYNDGFIISHLKARQRYPECAIGYAGLTSINEEIPADSRGVHPVGRYYFCTSQPEDVRIRILEGYKTVSYKRSFFEDDLSLFVNKHWNDDFVLSAYMGYKNIKKIVLKCENCEGNYSPRVESFPVVCHAPIDGSVHGCNAFRRNENISKEMNDVALSWYKLGYLER